MFPKFRLSFGELSGWNTWVDSSIGNSSKSVADSTNTSVLGNSAGDTAWLKNDGANEIGDFSERFWILFPKFKLSFGELSGWNTWVDSSLCNSLKIVADSTNALELFSSVSNIPATSGKADSINDDTGTFPSGLKIVDKSIVNDFFSGILYSWKYRKIMKFFS